MEKNAKANKMTFGKFFLKYNTYIMFVVMFLACTLLSDTFLSWRNIGNLIRQNTATMWMVMGMLFVIITGGIDLSVGSNIAVGAVVTAYFMANLGWAPVPSILVAVLCAAACGAITGVLVAYAKMAPFVASLAMMTMARGGAMYLAGGAPIALPKETIEWISTYSFLKGTGLEASLGEITSLLCLILIFIVVLTWFITKYTSFGRLVYAVGSNETAVRLAGLNVRRIKFSVYLISGLFCGIAGVINATRTKTGAPIAGTGWELDAIASCVIGGASLSGGVGSPVKALVGTFVLALITNIMNLCSVPTYPQDIIKGAIIILAVLMQTSSFKDE